MISYTKNATVTRTKAIYGKRISEADYRELVNKKNIAEVAEYLKKNTHYASALSTINTASVHRGHLEAIVEKYAFDMYLNLCDFQQLRKERFYNYLIVLSEIREILSIILHMNAQSSDEYISSMPSYLLSKTSFDLIELAKSKDFKSLLQQIKYTPYHNVLKDMKPDSFGNIDYLRCEFALRTYYLKWMMDVIKKDFRGSSRDSLLKQIEMQVDFINIINAYRMKKYYGLSASEIEKNIFPFYGKLSLKKQKEIFGTKTAEEFLTAFSKTFYGRYFINEDNQYFEHEVSKLRSQAARRSLMFSQNAAVSIYSLMYLIDIEVDNITTVIEGIRYEKKPDYILNMIIPL